MSDIDEGGYVFPSPVAVRLNDDLAFSEDFGAGGMSLRAYIATAVTAAIVGLDDAGHSERTIALAAVAQADALIAALKERG